MSKTMLYEHIDTGERQEFYKMGGYHFDANNKYVPTKELKCLWKFIGYLHGAELRKFKAEKYNSRAKFTVRRLQCETTTTINGFKIRKYKMKRVEI